MRTAYVRRSNDGDGGRNLGNGLVECDEPGKGVESGEDIGGLCTFEKRLQREAGVFGLGLGHETEGSCFDSIGDNIVWEDTSMRDCTLAGVEPERLRVRKGDLCDWRCMCACCV